MRHILFLLTMLVVAESYGQPIQSTNESNKKGIRILENALTTLGSQVYFDPSNNFLIEGQGWQDISAEYQGFDTDSKDQQPFSEYLYIAEGGEKVGYDMRPNRIDGTRDWVRFLYTNNDEMLFAHLTDSFAFHGKEAAYNVEMSKFRRMIPTFLLQDGLETRENIRYQGNLVFEGNACYNVLVTIEQKHTLNLFIDTTEFIVRGLEYMINLPMHGDSNIKWVFKSYKNFASIGQYPSGYRLFIGDHQYKDINYTITSGSDAAAHFKLPDGIPVPPRPEPSSNEEEPSIPPAPQVDTIAQNIYRAINVRPGFHPMFIEFEDYIMAVEAPTGWVDKYHIPASNFVANATTNSISRKFIQTIKKHIPNKPIKFVVLTHFHSDHSGGIAAFLDENITVLSSKTTNELARQMLASESSSSTPNYSMETVGKKHLVKDRTMEVELIDVGKNPHCKGMLVVHIPKQGVLYVADLFEPITRVELFPTPSHRPINEFFARWLQKNDLNPKVIYGSHSFRPATVQHIQNALKP